MPPPSTHYYNCIEFAEFLALSFDIVVVIFLLAPSSGVSPLGLARFTWHPLTGQCGVFCSIRASFWMGFDNRMLREELGWNQQKSDELLLPVIQRVNKRGAAAAANKQSNLDTYFGDSIGRVGGSAIPRKRQAYTSKRLQKVVTDYREDQRKRSRTNPKRDSSTLSDSDHSGDKSMEELDGNGGTPKVIGGVLDVDRPGDHGECDPGSESVSRTRKTPKPMAGTAAPTKRKARKPSKNTTVTTSRSTKRKERANDSDDYDDERVDDEVVPVPARPRPKPVRKEANRNTDARSKFADQESDG